MSSRTERFLSTREVAAYLNVSPETILRWHRSGKLPGGRRLSSNLLRFRGDELEAWIEGEPPPRTLEVLRGGS